MTDEVTDAMKHPRAIPHATDRRRFLRGAGGVTLALPFLPSLVVPPRAHGAEASPPRGRFFVALLTEHGGISAANMFPQSLQLTRLPLFGSHTIHHAPLPRRLGGGRAILSEAVSGPESLLSPAIAERTNILRGLDIPFYISHHGGGHLGNYAGNDGVGGNDAKAAQAQPNVTIDQQMAWSPSFYRSLSGVRERFVFLSKGHPNFGHSYTWSSPSTRSGTIERTRATSNFGLLFDRLFGGGTGAGTPGTPAPRAPIVDGVLDAYRSLRQSNARLANEDRQRLDDHMDRMAELQRRLAQAPPAQACATPARPSTAGFTREGLALFNDMITAAFLCGATRVVVMDIRDRFVTVPGNWHQDVAHRHTDPQVQQTLLRSNQLIFQYTLLDLASKLYVDAGGGRPLLDDSLLLWAQESGQFTHSPIGMPIVTIGRAGGALKTGLFVDYRNQVAASQFNFYGQAHFAGLTYNRLMATVLHTMGVDSREWQAPGRSSFGQDYFQGNLRNFYAAGLPYASEPLPVIT